MKDVLTSPLCGQAPNHLADATRLLACHSRGSISQTLATMTKRRLEFTILASAVDHSWRGIWMEGRWKAMWVLPCLSRSLTAFIDNMAYLAATNRKVGIAQDLTLVSDWMLSLREAEL